MYHVAYLNLIIIMFKNDSIFSYLRVQSPEFLEMVNIMPKIGYIVCANLEREQNPSTRLTVENMRPLLDARGYESTILFSPYSFNPRPNLNPEKVVRKAQKEGVDIVYFQKMGKLAEVAHALKESGIQTVFGVCDYVDELMSDACDATITVSDYIRDHYSDSIKGKVHVVHDGIEHPEKQKSGYGVHTTLDAVVLSSQGITKLPVLTDIPSYVIVEVIGRYSRDPSMVGGVLRHAHLSIENGNSDAIVDCAFRIVKNLPRRLGLIKGNEYHPNGLNGHDPGVPFRKVEWDITTVYDRLPTYDVGLIPIEFDGTSGFNRTKSKSSNMLTQLMAAGLPVIASPVPSYLNIIKQGENGFIADSPEEWVAILEELRDPKLRESVGRVARESVLERFSQERQADMVVGIFDSILDQSTVLT